MKEVEGIECRRAVTTCTCTSASTCALVFKTQKTINPRIRLREKLRKRSTFTLGEKSASVHLSLRLHSIEIGFVRWRFIRSYADSRSLVDLRGYDDLRERMCARVSPGMYVLLLHFISVFFSLRHLHFIHHPHQMAWHVPRSQGGKSLFNMLPLFLKFIFIVTNNVCERESVFTDGGCRGRRSFLGEVLICGVS